MIKAKVLSEKTRTKRPKLAERWWPLAKYDITVTQVYKGGDAIQKLLSIDNSTANAASVDQSYNGQVYTSPWDAGCGVDLEKGAEYVLSGYSRDDKMRINLCGWISKFGELSKMELRGLKGAFDCSCTIYYCWGERCLNNRSKDLCSFGIDAFPYEPKCSAKGGLCLRRGNACRWVDDQQ